jgi:hypothetical protein
MPNRVATLRSSVTGSIPNPGTRAPGELWVNFADSQLGYIDASQTAQKLLAVRLFSTTANYVVGDFVVYQGVLYRAIAPSGAGGFTPGNWAKSGGAVSVGDAPPTSPDPGALWWDSVGGQLYVWFQDVNSSQWVIAVNQSATAIPAITNPLMNGPVAVGTSTNYARADHVHPVDVSLLPLTGGTITGALTVTGNINSSGNLVSNNGNVFARAAASNSVFWCQNNVGVAVGNFFWNTAGQVGFNNLASSPNAGCYIDSAGAFNISGMTITNAGAAAITGIVTANGYTGRQGPGGPTGQLNNFYWNTTALQVWIGSVNAGNLTPTSDYRAKKDVIPLGSTWETVKALKPISFTYKDFSFDAEPLVLGSDEEYWGFLAHELQETLIPSAATGVKDQENLIQSPNPWTVIATLTKALQEAMERIEALEAGR